MHGLQQCSTNIHNNIPLPLSKNCTQVYNFHEFCTEFLECPSPTKHQFVAEFHLFLKLEMPSREHLFTLCTLYLKMCLKKNVVGCKTKLIQVPRQARPVRLQSCTQTEIHGPCLFFFQLSSTPSCRITLYMSNVYKSHLLEIKQDGSEQTTAQNAFWPKPALISCSEVKTGLPFLQGRLLSLFIQWHSHTSSINFQLDNNATHGSCTHLSSTPSWKIYL